MEKVTVSAREKRIAELKERLKKHQSGPLEVPAMYKDENFVYEWGVENEYTNNIHKMIDLGFEFVNDEKLQQQTASVLAGETTGSDKSRAVTRPDGFGGKHYLMRIHKEDHAVIVETNLEKDKARKPKLLNDDPDPRSLSVRTYGSR